jgi:LysM repeat protein
MSVDTTLGELADMLLTKDFNYQTELLTNEDVVMFGKFSVDRADELTKDISESSLQQLINSAYITQLDLLRRARKFKSKSKEYKALQEALFQKGTRELLPTIARSLKPYQTATGEQRTDLNEEEIIMDAIAAEERRLQNERNRSLSFVTSLETTLEIVKNIKNDLNSILNEGRYDTRSKIALINIYQQQLEAYDLMVREINEVFESENITTGSALTNLVNDIAAEIERSEKKITDIYERSNVDFYLDLTKYMQEFLEKELKSNIEPIKQYLSEQEYEEFYKTALQRELTNDEINSLANKNVPIDIVSKFLDDYNFFKLDENRIKASLTGVAPDVRWGNRFLESYSSSNDPIVGGLAIFIQNQRTKAQQNALQKSREYRTKLPQLLDAVGFSRINVSALTDMVMSKDKILDFDEKGNPVEFEVYTYMNEFGNGYRYELDKLKYNVTTAEETGDRQQIAAAKKELNNFINDFFWQEYLPEVYKVDEIFDESPVGKEAWLDMRSALDEYQAFNNSIDNELERFEKYSILQAKWDAYQRLSDLNYFDGTPKVDDPAKGIYDLSKALVIRQYKEAKRKYYEFVPREGSLETAYNEFVLEQEAKGIKKGIKGDSDRFEDAYNQWLKQNVQVVYAPEYYEAKQSALDTIRRLEEKKGKEDSTAPLFQEMMELLYGYRDEQGQPIPGSLGADRLLKINDLNQRINDIRSSQERNDNLSQDQREELKSYVLALKNNPNSLTNEQMQRYVELTNMRKSDGLSTLEQAQLEGAYAELAELNSRVPTEYYMEALNFYLEKQNIPAVEAKNLDEFINSADFKDYLKADEDFAKWFGASHVTKVKYNTFGRRYTVFERNAAYSVSIPSDDNQILKTEITDRSTGKPITIKGMPNARHSIYRVKSEYRSIPNGADRKDYIGKVINNRGEYLPRPYNPNDVNSAAGDRFINKDYRDLKKQGGAQYELLEYLKEYHLYFQEGAAQNAKLYLDMPRYGVSDVVQKFQSGEYVDKAKRFAGTTKEWLKSTWGRAQDDFNRGFANYDPDKNVYVNTDPLNREIAYVPVTGLYKLKMDQVDMDLFKITGEYLMSIENQKVLIDSLPRVQAILKQLEDPRNNTKTGKFSKQTGKAASKKNARNNRLEQVRSLIDKEYYGVQLSQSANQYVFLTKLMSNFSKLASFSSLALNIPSDLKNRYGQLAQNVIEGAGGEFVNLKDLANARAWAFNTMIKWAAKDIYAQGVPSITAQIIENFDAVFKTEDQLGQSVSRSLFRDLMNGSWATDFRKSAEMEAALQLFGGFMKHQKVEQRTTDGKVIYLDYLDAWETDPNGIIKLKEGIDPDYGTKAIDHVYTQGETLQDIANMYNTTVEKLKERNKIESTKDLEDGTELVITKANRFNEIKNRYHGLSRKLYGAYDSFGQPEGNKYMIYRMFFFMRKWFTPMFVNHFGMDTSAGNVGRARYDWAMGTTELGYYITAFKTMVKLFKTKGRYYNWMTAKEKAAYKKIGTQMMTIIALALVAAMVFGYDEDDEDRWEKISQRSGGYIGEETFNTYGFMQNHLLALTMGVMNETSTFLPIPKLYGVQFGLDDYVKFVTSTGSIFNSTGKTYAQILQNLADTITMDEGAYYKRDTGPYWFQEEGELKLWRNLFKVVGYSGVTGDTETLIKNIEKSSIIK